jgi:hypothetical protein
MYCAFERLFLPYIMSVYFDSVSAFRSRTTGFDKVAEELVGELTQMEKKLVESHDIVELRGKVH